MLKKFISLGLSTLVISLALAGCGTVAKSSGVLQIGPDTYRVMARASVGDRIESQKMAFNEASDHCARQVRRLMTIGTLSTQYQGYELTFRCLAEGDPELNRPTLHKTPDTVIQINK